MDSLLGNSVGSLSNSPLNTYSENSKYSRDALIIEKTLVEADSININFKDKYKSLSITAKEIVNKLNELLKDKLPKGIESLNPEENTAEATSTRIVQGATAFFGVFEKQNPNLSGQKLLDKFMETIKAGIQSGYDDAYNTLQGLGAFELDGIKEGVEQTKILIEQKLNAFYEMKKEELSVSSETEQSTENQPFRRT